MKRVIFVYLLFVILFSQCIISCDNRNSSENANSKLSNNSLTVSILITKDYGREQVATKTVKYQKGKTAMDILVDNFEVETSYGGSFIKSINDIESKTKAGEQSGEDWLYFINKKEATVGVNDYMVKPGDEIWFDFRKWDMESISEKFENP